jgi:hypothetical protein
MTKTVLSTQCKTFRFYNPYDINQFKFKSKSKSKSEPESESESESEYNQNYCTTRIKVKELKYNNEPAEIYYDISYKYRLNNQSLACELTHPFYDNKQDSHGEIIKKNSLTEKLVEYLLMNFADLKKETGQTSPLIYKLNVMKSISLLWD